MLCCSGTRGVMLVQGRKDQVRHIGILLSYEQVWCQCEKKVIEDGLERGQCHFMCLSIYAEVYVCTI